MMNNYLENLYNPKLYEMPGCTLQAYGINFIPKAFLSESNIPVEKVLLQDALGLPDEIRGKIKRAELPYQGAFDIFDTPYLLISISEASELKLQIEDAILFLKQYLNDLKKLRNCLNIENVLIQFLTERDESLVNSLEFPAEFSELYSEIGIQGVTLGKANPKD